MTCTHEFEVMGREKRQFVHELAAFFGCVTQSFDPEPKRNVVATATKGEVKFNCSFPDFGTVFLTAMDKKKVNLKSVLYFMTSF